METLNFDILYQFGWGHDIKQISIWKLVEPISAVSAR